MTDQSIRNLRYYQCEIEQHANRKRPVEILGGMRVPMARGMGMGMTMIMSMIVIVTVTAFGLAHISSKNVFRISSPGCGGTDASFGRD
jgi:hypothetical protein